MGTLEATVRRNPSVSPLLRLLLGVIALAAIVVPVLLVSNAPHIVAHKRPPVVLSKRVVPQQELPPVEPVELQALSPDDARAINDSIPFSLAPNPAARAFHLSGAADSQARAIDCLAAAVYYEAGDDSLGQRAVAQVILNRMRHPAFPKTVCGVVFQGAERSTGCQFTFTCDGAILRYTPTEAAWTRARQVARMALSGTVFRPVGHATHYHTDWVVPYWSASLDKITEVHTHLFFRWAGWWGTPPAFNRGYAGVEPNVPLMARLSPSHVGDGAAPAPAIAVGDLAGLEVNLAAIPDSAIPASVAGDPNVFLIVLPKGIVPDNFPALAIKTCGERPYCKFMAWSDASKKPPKLPPSGEQAAAMSFSYLRDDSAAYAKALWNCDQFKRPSPVQCMRRIAFGAPEPMPAPSPSPTPEAKEGPAGLSGVRRKGDPAPAIAKPPVNLTLPAPRPSPTLTPSPKN
ncbi:cell wall hydrolase [Sphingomonas sp. dw_22]|uniref:cell wall hydrolase n=1 Tax=Sphingomonas sp. dw_22 TaxID=2721175 RepID=UPI001BD3664C|nr:cell wall hydrolase [Sphingomonas sp. dw_22]